MSDDLRKIYVAAGLADRFWDTSTPTALWRAQKQTDFHAGAIVLEPHPGSATRPADVKVVDRDNQKIVLGCRCVKGDFRGISTYDMKVTWYGSRTTKHFRMAANTPIPPGLAVTKDHRNAQGAYHYTIAPKDDMPLQLFMQQLKAMSQGATLVT
jgi:hypothetical protein